MIQKWQPLLLLTVFKYLTGLSFLVIQHVEQEAQLTGQTELTLTEVTQENAAQGLNVIQHLQTREVIQRGLRRTQLRGSIKQSTYKQGRSLRNKGRYNKRKHNLENVYIQQRTMGHVQKIQMGKMFKTLLTQTRIKLHSAS